MRITWIGLVIVGLAGSSFGASPAVTDIDIDFNSSPPTPFGHTLSVSIKTTVTYRVPTLATAAPSGSVFTMTMGGTALAAGSNFIPDPPNVPPQFFQPTSFASGASVNGSFVGEVNAATQGQAGDNYAGGGSVVKGSKSFSLDLGLLNPNTNGYVDFTVITEAGFGAGTRSVSGQSVAALALVGVGTLSLDLPGEGMILSGQDFALSAAELPPTLPSGLTYIPDDDGSPLILYKGFAGSVTENLAPELLVGLPSSLVPEPTSALVGAAVCLPCSRVAVAGQNKPSL